MNLGIPGVVAVGSNITHKFGKALVGSRSHSELGHVDRKLGFYMLIGAFIGVRLAVLVNEMLFHMEGGGHGEGGGSAAGDLYISTLFVVVLSLISASILRDALRKDSSGEGPSTKLAEYFGRLNLPPMIYFPVADVTVSLWIVSVVGLATGYLAGTIGVGGFIGVPAMIYIFGIPTAVAAGTELFLAVFLGAWGAVNYVWAGFVDLRLVMMLYMGSLIGIHIGVYGTKVIQERLIRIVTGVIIILCVISRGLAIPVYLRKLGMVEMNPNWDVWWNGASTVLLYASGLSGILVILISVAKAHHKRRRVHTMLTKS
ncbi:sulfite exporter TauE/SafE [bacterium BMS3Bbin04]|nr:sulfite exporter TauE/SafE [bacterium BMS3Bbin04]